MSPSRNLRPRDYEPQLERHVKTRRARSSRTKLHPRKVMKGITAAPDQHKDPIQAPLTTRKLYGRTWNKSESAEAGNQRKVQILVRSVVGDVDESRVSRRSPPKSPPPFRHYSERPSRLLSSPGTRATFGHPPRGFPSRGLSSSTHLHTLEGYDRYPRMDRIHYAGEPCGSLHVDTQFFGGGVNRGVRRRNYGPTLHAHTLLATTRESQRVH